MNQDEIYAGLREVFAEVFLTAEPIVLTPTLAAGDVEGWDSYRQVEILLATQERFGVRFTSREIDSLQCVGDLAKLVQAKLAGTHA